MQLQTERQREAERQHREWLNAGIGRNSRLPRCLITDPEARAPACKHIDGVRPTDFWDHYAHF